MSFFQLLRFLKMTHGETVFETKQIQLCCAEGMSFPSQDFSIDSSHHKISKIFFNFMGLFGVDGCLPFYFNEIIQKNNENSERLKNFLDIFHHRLYELYFKAWQSQQPDINLELGDNTWLAFHKSLLPRLTAEVSPLALAPYFIGQKRTLGGLLHIVKSQLPDIPIEIKTMQTRWCSLAMGGRLGNGKYILGDNILLGERYLSGSQSIEIHFGPLSSDTFFRLKKMKKALLAQLHKYLDVFQSLTLFALRVHLPQTLCLGKQNITLGSGSFLGKAPLSLRKKL